RLVDVPVQADGGLVALDRFAHRPAAPAHVVEASARTVRSGELAGTQSGGRLELEARVDRGVLRRAVEVEHALRNVRYLYHFGFDHPRQVLFGGLPRRAPGRLG